MTHRFLFLLLMFFCSSLIHADWNISNDSLSFYSDQDKYLEIRSTEPDNLVITLSKALKPLDFLDRYYPMYGEKEIVFPEDQSIPRSENGWSSRFVRKYVNHIDPKSARDAGGISEMFSFEIRTRKGTTKVLLPVREKGIYLMEIRNVKKSTYYIVNITDIALFVKRDEEQTLVYSVRRKDGLIVESVRIRPEGYNDPRNREFFTSEKGLLFLNTAKFQRYGKIVGIWSNNYDVVAAPVYAPAGRKKYKVISFPDKENYLLSDTINLFTYFFKLDEFKDYTEHMAETYTVIFNGLTNRFDAGKQFAHKSSWAIPTGTKAGTYPIITILGETGFTNHVSLYNDFPRKVFIAIKPSKPVYAHGQRIKIRTAIHNAGNSGLRHPAVKAVLSFYDMTTGELVREKKTKQIRLWGKHFAVSKSTRWLPRKNYRVRADISVQFADGYTLHSYKEFFVLRAKEDVSLSINKKIFLPNEIIPVAIQLKKYEDLLSYRKMEITVTSRQEKSRYHQKIILQSASSTTNIPVAINNPGPYTVNIRVLGAKDVKNSTDIWILPLNGDIPLEKDMTEEIRIFSDKEIYSFGDIARILVVTKRKAVNSLFTYEGNNIFFAHPLEFQNNYEVIDVPVLDKNKPNSLIVVQSIISNKSYIAYKNIHVPYLSKNIIFNISSILTNSTRNLSIATKNIWERSISTFSLLRVGPPDIPSISVPSAYFQNLFYQDIEPAVQTYFPSFQIRLKDKKTFYSYGIDTDEKSIYPYSSGEYIFEPTTEAPSNIIFLDEENLFEHDALRCQINSVTRDGKVSTTNTTIQLESPLTFSMLLPEYMHPGDEPEACIHINNISDIKQKVRFKAEFQSRSEFRYKTNTIELEPGGDGHWQAPMISPSSDVEQQKSQISVRTYRKSFNLTKNLDVFPWPGDVRFSPYFKAKKTYRRIGMDMFLISRVSSPVRHFKAEDSVLVTITLDWKEGTLPDSSQVYVQDIVPSGFKVVMLEYENRKRRVETTYNRIDDKVEFRINTGDLQKTTRIHYLLKAEIPGKYRIVEPLVYMGEFPYSSEKNPVKVKKELKISF